MASAISTAFYSVLHNVSKEEDLQGSPTVFKTWDRWLASVLVISGTRPSKQQKNQNESTLFCLS